MSLSSTNVAQPIIDGRMVSMSQHYKKAAFKQKDLTVPERTCQKVVAWYVQDALELKHSPLISFV